MKKRKERLQFKDMSRTKKKNVFNCLKTMRVKDILKKYNITHNTINKIVKERIKHHD